MFWKSKNPQEEIDHYSGFNPSDQLRPKVNRADFFKLTGFDFGWFLLEPINIAESYEKEPELAKRFSAGQKALYFWWFVDAEVTNGGFVQFYYNGKARYVPAIIKGLEHVGDHDMASLIKRAHKIYLENKSLIEKARKRNLFGSDLYEKLDALSLLDDEYYEINAKTMAIIEKYARQNPNEFCVDENGLPFDSNFSGKCTSKYENGKLKEEFYLTNGVIDGEFNTYYETGKKKTLNTYASGEQIGEQKEWYENGNIKTIITIDQKTKERKKEYYYKNGQISKLEHLNANDENKGEYKEWNSNGQLKEQSVYIANTERIGDWLKYWKDGSKKLEAEFKDGEVYFHNYWNEKGEQLLKNGTGLYINEFEMEMFSDTTLYRYETEYKNYKRHGLSKSYTDGILGLEQEFKNGVEHGTTRDYDNEGNLKEEKIYEEGKLVSAKKIE